MHQHDHSSATHNAKCDACDYISSVHAHDDEEAADALSSDLAAHNKEVHNEETNPDQIKDAVRVKMKSAS